MHGRSARREEPPAVLLAIGITGLPIAMAGNIAGEASGMALVVIGSLMTMAAGLTFFSLLIDRLRRREQSQP